MRWLLFISLTLVFIACTAYFEYVNYQGNGKTEKVVGNVPSRKGNYQWDGFSLGTYRNNLIAYTVKNKLNSNYCFLIDMKLASGLKRFYIYDLKQDRVIQAGLVAHGSGNHGTDSVIFSNIPGSNCTSVGKYKIGKSYQGKFGLAYKLYGLDKTNNNAFSRFVVLHSHSCVPENEIAPLEICRSWGCPTVAPIFLTQLKIYIEKSPAPVLLWIFN